MLWLFNCERTDPLKKGDKIFWYPNNKKGTEMMPLFKPSVYLILNFLCQFFQDFLTLTRCLPSKEFQKPWCKYSMGLRKLSRLYFWDLFSFKEAGIVHGRGSSLREEEDFLFRRIAGSPLRSWLCSSLYVWLHTEPGQREPPVLQGLRRPDWRAWLRC